MEKQYNQQNYRNRRKKTYRIVDKKRFVLAVMLATSLSINSVIGISALFDKTLDKIDYNNEIKKYESLVIDSKRRTDDLQNEQINTYVLAQNIRQLGFNNKEDFYHHLIGIAQHMQWNRSDNMESLISSLNLDALNEENPTYPSSEDFLNFLKKHELLNSDGTINLDAWIQYDQEVFKLQTELEETKRGGSLS